MPHGHTSSMLGYMLYICGQRALVAIESFDLLVKLRMTLPFSFGRVNPIDGSTRTVTPTAVAATSVRSSPISLSLSVCARHASVWKCRGVVLLLITDSCANQHYPTLVYQEGRQVGILVRTRKGRKDKAGMICTLCP